MTTIKYIAQPQPQSYLYLHSTHLRILWNDALVYFTIFKSRFKI